MITIPEGKDCGKSYSIVFSILVTNSIQQELNNRYKGMYECLAKNAITEIIIDDKEYSGKLSLPIINEYIGYSLI